jgi:uncharacterized protein (DUF2342 family)
LPNLCYCSPPNVANEPRAVRDQRRVSHSQVQRILAMMTGFERYAKKTRRAAFLEEMEQVVP